MATQPHPRPTSNKQDSLDLLQALIEAPPTPLNMRLQPIALRSTDAHRRHALRHYSLRTWVDALLSHAERLVLLITLAFFGYWFVDGPARDWLHDWQQPAPSAEVANAAPRPPSLALESQGKAGEHRLPASGPRGDRAVPLPYTTPGMAYVEPESDFIAPREVVPAAPIAVAPQP